MQRQFCKVANFTGATTLMLDAALPFQQQCWVIAVCWTGKSDSGVFVEIHTISICVKSGLTGNYSCIVSVELMVLMTAEVEHIFLCPFDGWSVYCLLLSFDGKSSSLRSLPELRLRTENNIFYGHSALQYCLVSGSSTMEQLVCMFKPRLEGCHNSALLVKCSWWHLVVDTNWQKRNSSIVVCLHVKNQLCIWKNSACHSWPLK